MNYNEPFIKVEWSDTPENLTQERIKRVKEYFKKKYNAADVKIITKIISNESNVKLKSLEISDSILDPQYQKNLIKDFIKEIKPRIEFTILNCGYNCKESLEKLPLKRNKEILQNIINLGMMDKYEKVINSCNCKDKKKRIDR